MTAATTRASALTATAWLVGLVTTASVAASSALVFGFRSPELHLVFDSVDACVALLLAFLLYGRYARMRRLQDLLVFQALLLLASAGLGMTLLVDVFSEVDPLVLGVWLPLTLRSLAAVLVLAAALAGDREVASRSHRTAWLLCWLGLATVVVVLWSTSGSLPAALDEVGELTAQDPVITGHPLLLISLGLAALLLLLASVLFTRQAGRRHDELLRWLGPAFALGGFARINYVLFPSIYSDWVYTGDLLRTGCYLLLLVGAAREIRQYWTARASLAVLEDRRRLARELHDGVIQEVGYARSEATTITQDDALAGRIIDACDRALDEARAALSALSEEWTDASLGEKLSRAAYDVLARYGGELVVDLNSEVSADPAQQHALMRITREAVANAVRHGAATSIRLRLERDSEVRRLVLQDDGLGFDVPAESAGTGYGLTSMRERAQAMPGSFELHSRPGEGTKVMVEW